MPSPRRAALITSVVCLSTVVSHSIGRSVYGLLVPAIEDDLGLSHSDAGLPSSGIFVLYIVGVLGVVVASPRVEPVTIMRIGFVISAIGLTIAATAQNLVALTVGVSLVGGAGAGIWMTAPVLATAYVSPRRRGLVMGVLASTIGLANITLGFGVRSWRAAADDQLLWRPIWWVALIYTVVLLTALVTIARFPRTERIGQQGLMWHIVRRLPHWRQVTVAYALFGGMSAGFSSFVVAALEEHGGLDRSSSAVVFSLMGVTSMVTAPLAGALSDRAGRIVVMRGALFVLMAASLLVAIGGRWPAVCGALLYSAGASSFPALIAAHVRDSLDNRSFSQALAIITILFSMLAAALPLVVGAVADATGSFRLAYVVVAALPALALGVLATVSARPAATAGRRT